MDKVLKRIIAAVSGPIALEPGSVQGKFKVAVISDEESGEAPKVVNSKIYLDQSYSMVGAPIASLNKMLPELLSRLQRGLELGQTLNVTVFTFDDQVRVHQKIEISETSELPPWIDVPALGSTDLIPIGRGLRLDDPGTPQFVVAFTDGGHNGPNIDSHYEELRELQASGQFAKPFLCKAGYVQDDYFSRLSEIFAGSVHQGESVPECIDQIIRAIPELVKPKRPIVLSVSEGNVVVWQEVATGVQTTSQTVSDGDKITFGKFAAVVNTAKKKDETKEEMIERLSRELEALKKGK